MADKNDFKAAKEAFAEFCKTIQALRDKKSGCPWDLEQDHVSLRRYMIEEAYEAAEAMSEQDHKAICEELGDVLLQVVLNAQVAEDAKQFEITNVIQSINEKMRRRHPHVFAGNHGADTSAKVRAQWETIKAEEKKSKPKTHESIFEEVKSKKSPASIQALEIGKIAHRIQFDWLKTEDVQEQFLSEVEELKEALGDAKFKASPEVKAELGDVYFTLAQLCRHLGQDPETTALDGNRKFLIRFGKMEEIARKRKLDITKAPTSILEELWNEAKKK